MINTKNYIFYFIITLIISIYLQFINISESLLDIHSFRQTQTAITTYWFLKEGFTIKYLTPIFGFPWSIPFEFPTYQIFVYIFSKVFNISNLDLSGRIVSLLFYYISFIPIYMILKNLELNKKIIYTTFIILLSTPIFIFWSRTFMIESCALFVSLLFIFSVLQYIKKGSSNYIFIIFLFAVISALTKITTFLIALLFLFFLYLFTKNFKELFNKKIIIATIISITSIFIGIFWTEFTNNIKELNTLAVQLMSSSLTKWNFGTLEQRLDLANYKNILHHIFNNSILFIFLPILLYFKDNRRLIFICLITYISSFMILFNLYFVHNYYWYANSLFLVIALAIGFNNLFKYLKSSLIIHFIFILIISINILAYFQYYYKVQNINNSENKIILISNIIKENTKENDLIFINGLDWNSSLSYYSQRKVIMLPNWVRVSIKDKKFDSLIQNSLKENSLTSIVLCNNKIQEKDLTIKFFKFVKFEEKIIDNCLILINKKDIQ